MKARPLVFAGPIVVFMIWAIASYVAGASHLLLPTPGMVIRDLWIAFTSGNIYPDILATLWRLIIGFSLGAVVGILGGAILGFSMPLYKCFELLLDFSRSLPVMCLFPLFLLLFGLGNKPKIATTVWTVALVIAVNTIYGVRQAPRTRLLAAKTMGARGARLLTKVIVPSAAPTIIGGVRVGISLGLVVVIVTEMFTGTEAGLGKRIYDAGLIYNSARMYGAIIVAGTLGYLMNKLVVAAETRVAHWAGA